MDYVNKSLTLKPHGEYIREVKHLLSKEAFAPDPKKLYYLAGYFIVLTISYSLFGRTDKIIYYFLLTCLNAHCLSCIAFLAHELSHNSIVRNRKIRYPLEVIALAIMLLPPTRSDMVHYHTLYRPPKPRSDSTWLPVTSESTRLA